MEKRQSKAEKKDDVNTKTEEQGEKVNDPEAQDTGREGGNVARGWRSCK